MLTAARRRLGRGVALALLPLSTVPFILAAPHILHGPHQPMPAPYAAPSAATLTGAEIARYTSPPAYSTKIPVLAFGAIGTPGAISQYQFARELSLLSQLGYQTISLDQYTAWRRGKATGLPPKPILLTFDNGLLCSYRGADQALAAQQMRATMFILTGQLVLGKPRYLDWPELTRMRTSGRWDIGFAGNLGYTKVPYDAAGDTAPYYTALEYRHGQSESFAAYQARVSTDISTGLKLMSGHGFSTQAIAMPYGQDGQGPESDPRVGPYLTALLSGDFAAVFVEPGVGQTGYSTSTGPAIRYQIASSTTLDELYRFLADADPARKAPERARRPAAAATHKHPTNAKASAPRGPMSNRRAHAPASTAANPPRPNR